MKIVVRGARVIDPSQGLDDARDLWISAGKLVSVGDAPAGFGTPGEEIQAQGFWAAPGLVDLSARVSADLPAETGAAAAGGFTSVCCPPDADPVIDSTPAVRNLLAAARSAGKVRVFPIGALSKGLEGTGLADHDALGEAGCVAIGNGMRAVPDSKVMRSAMRYAAALGLPVFLLPSDPWLGTGCAHEGRVATRLGLEGIPVAAETAGMARDLALVEDSGVRAHFCRLSSARAVAMLEAARESGLPVSADVAMHQLFLSEQDISDFDARAHTLPPLRSSSDREALLAAVAAGVVEAICSDHTPLGVDARLAPFAATAAGISTLETTLALGLRLVEDGILDAGGLISAMSTAPARIIGRPWGMSVGRPADLVLIDPDAVWRCQPEQFVSRGHNSPFASWEFHGRVVRTMIAGETVFSRQP